MASGGSSMDMMIDDVGGSSMDMMIDDVGTDDISLSMPYEQEGYAEQDGLDIPTPNAKKSSPCKVFQLHNTRR